MNGRTLIVVSYVLVLFSDLFVYMAWAMQVSIDSTYIIAASRLGSLICLLIFSSKNHWKNKIPVWGRIFFQWFIIWSLIAFVRGIFSATDYWDWKYLCLDTSFSLSIPAAIVAGILYTSSEGLFNFITTKLFLFGYILIPLTLKIDLERELFARGLMVCICFFMLIIPYVKLKWQLAILAVMATSVVLAYDFRSNVLRIGFALILLAVYYARKYVPLGLLKITCVVFFFVPLVFLGLGLNGDYNVFKPKGDDIDQYAISYDNGADETNIALDTRTFLYQEVLASMNERNSFLFGEGGLGKYKTEYFFDETNPTRGRYSSEVGFLNQLLYTGIVGVLLYALVMFSAVYYGLTRSNNYLCKMIAVFIAFRWIMFFIEDFQRYDGNYYFIWLSIGLCFSNQFRALSDSELKSFFSFQKNPGLVQAPA